MSYSWCMLSHPIPELKLTRTVEADPCHEAIRLLLKKDCKPLWERSTLAIAQIPLTQSLENCLRKLLHLKQLERGLERIEQLLNNEKKGLLALQKQQGTRPSLRVSRLLIVANDGSERFYRACEKILIQNSDRTLLLCVTEPSSRLTQCLLGKSEKVLKALLVSDRDAVSSLLLSLVQESPTP